MTLDWTAEREEYGWIAALAAMAALAFLLATWAGIAVGFPSHRIIISYADAIVRKVPLALQIIAGLLVLRAMMLRTFNPFRGLFGDLRARFGSPGLVAAAVLPIAIIPLLMASFGTLKMLMPFARDFTWDDRLAAADKLLFFGYQPWQFTHAVFGGELATEFIDLAYSKWVVALYLSVLCFALLAPRYERARFFLSFGASWLLIGVLGAYLFASAGPCYAQAIGTVSALDFAPLMERLKEIHENRPGLQAFAWQEVLWSNHSNQRYGFAMGVSAMPSMHNAICVLYALALGRAPRFLRLGAWTYAALIFIGSIHLGWHYAIDGIAAGAMMWGIWAGAGVFLERIGYARAIQGGSGEDGETDLPDLAGKPVAI